MTKPVVLFVSPLADDGADEVALGFSATSARDGVKTVLLNMDPRSDLQMSTRRSETPPVQALSPMDALVHYLQPVDAIPGLDVVSAYDVFESERGDLLKSEALRWLIDELRKKYDMVVICCAPILILEDANSGAPFVDAVLLVTRFGRTTEHELASAAARLKINHAPLIGAVMNGVDPQTQAGQNSLNVSHYPRQGRAYLRC